MFPKSMHKFTISKPRAPCFCIAPMVVFVLALGHTMNHWKWYKVEPPEEYHKKYDISNQVRRSFQSNIDWKDVFSFLPYGSPPCDEVHRAYGSKLNFTFPTKFSLAAQEHAQMLGKIRRKMHVKFLEGHSGALPWETAIYLKLASLPFVKTICETGFNAGHSAVTWLSANENTHLYSFDIGLHDYAKEMANFLLEKFPDRITITWGDSTKTLPRFHAENPNVICDIAIIDGGHTNVVALQDFDNFRNMTSENSILLLDDYPSKSPAMIKHLGSMWETKKRRGEVLEIFRCFSGVRGLTIARMLY